jgi:SAM-dependent methyltransferase
VPPPADRTADVAQYADDRNLRARQRLWETSRREPPFSLYPWVLDQADLHGGERVLEVGCGNGAYMALVDAVGVDRSLGMLAAARERSSGPLVAGDAEQLPFADAAFDVVLAPHMLYHVADRVAAAGELRRVLAPGGTCVAVTNGERNHHELVRLVEDAVGQGWQWRRPSDVAFSLENGAAQLRTAFAEVERRDCPGGTVSITDAETLAAYLASVGDFYEAEVSGWTTWAVVVDDCRRAASAVIARDGALRVTSAIGAFVCR